MNHFQKSNKKLEKLRSSFFLLGIIIAGGFTLLAFEWTFPAYNTELEGVVVDEIEGDYVYVEPFEIEKEQKQETKMKTYRAKSTEFKVVENNTPEEKIEDKKEIDPTPKFNPDEWKTKEKPEPPAPFLFSAGSMPHYEDCAKLEEEERKICTQQKMYQHFNNEIHIPNNIKMMGSGEYTAFVYFEVNTKGEIINVKILNDKKHAIPKELEREAYNAVSTLPQLIPAKNHGKTVGIKYQVPIKFTVQ